MFTPPLGVFGIDDDVEGAERRYAQAVIPGLLKRGSMPILVASVQGRFLDFEGADEWDQLAMVRYRSRRDMFEFALELGERDQGVHKWASVEKTHVFPAKPVISLVMVRVLVAVVLAVVWLGLRSRLSLSSRRSRAARV